MEGRLFRISKTRRNSDDSVLCHLPIVAGISYEVLRWAGRSENIIVRVLSAPGLALQKLTTQEPDDSQIECAIAAMKGVLEDEPEE